MSIIAKIYNKLNPVNVKIDSLKVRVEDFISSQEQRTADIQDRLAQFSTCSEQLCQAINASRVRQQALNQTVNMISTKLTDLRFGSSQRIKVLFLVHESETWATLDGVYQLMVVDPRFEVILATCQRRYPASDHYSGETITHEFFERAGVPHIRLVNDDSYIDLDIIKTIAPDAIFRQSQWDADVPPAFAIGNLTFAKLYNVPYEILPVADQIFSLPGNFVFWERLTGLFTVNGSVANKYMEYSTQVQARATGHPKVEHIIEAEPSWPIESTNSKRVYWSAHHAIFTDWIDFGTIHQVHPMMLDFAKNHQDIDIVLSPHPGLRGSLERLKREDPQQASAIEEFFAQWDELENTALLPNGNTIGPMKACDVILTDGVSSLIEGQLSDKPIVFMERPDHYRFSEIGLRIAKGLNSLADYTSYANLEKMLLYFLDGGEDPREPDRKDNYQYLTEHDHAADNILQSILQDFGMV